MEIQKNKLWLKGFFPERSDNDIRRFCDNFGKSLHMSRPWNQDYIFLTYATEEEALQAQANFVRLRYICRFAKIPNTNRSSPTNSLPSDSSPSPATTDPEPSTSSRTSSPNKDRRRVHFSTDVDTTTTPQATPTQRANGAAKSKDVSVVAQPPQKTVFRNGEKIIITHVQSASSFYAHSVSRNEERHELIRKMTKLAKQCDYVKEPPKFMALAPYNKGYYRAIIKGQASNVHDLVLVTLVDIGLSLNVPCDKLKPIPNEYTTIKISNRFILDGVDGDTNESSYGAKCLHMHVGKELIMECDDVLVGRLSSVRLIHPETKQNINKQIKEMQRTFNEDELVRVPAPLGVNQKLITVDASKLASGCNLITLIEASNLSELMKQTKQIQAVGLELTNYPRYEPKEEGELCLVNYSDQWYRAVFIRKSTGDGDDLVVLLIDLCKGVLIKSESMRHITGELVHMPILVFTIAISGYGQTIDKAKVDSLLQKFKAMTMTTVKSVCESPDAANYTIEI